MSRSWFRLTVGVMLVCAAVAPLSGQSPPAVGPPIPVDVYPPAWRPAAVAAVRPPQSQPSAPATLWPRPQPAPPPETPAAPRPTAVKALLYGTDEPNTYPIDLPTALRLADANNPTVNVARARAREAAAHLDRARVAWVPNLTFGPSFFYHGGIDQNRRGDIFSVARGNFALLGGPTLRVDLADALYLPLVARRGVQSAAARSRAATNDAQLEAALAYLDLLETHALLAINADILTRVEQILTAAEAGLKAGTGKTAADANRAATELRVRQQERIVLRGRAGAAAARLARVLYLDPAVELIPFDPVIIPVVLVPAELGLNQLVATGLRNRPEAAAAVADLQAAGTLVRQARVTPFLPRAQADFLGGGFSGGLNDRFGPMRGQYNTFVGLAWELDNLGAGNAAMIRARQAAYEAVMYRFREVEARVSAEVVEAARTAAARFDTLDEAQEAVRQAEEMYRKFRDVSFGVPGPKGRLVFDALEVLTAVQALNQARVLYLQQVVEFNRSQFRLFTAMGQPASYGLQAAAPQPVDLPVVPPSAGPPPQPIR